MHQPVSVSAVIGSPLGPLKLIMKDGKLQRIDFAEKATTMDSTVPAPFKTVAKQLQEYFQGKRKHFSICSFVTGTPFQKKVWNAIAAIPYGNTASYGDIAASIGHPNAVRAVGTACKVNALPLVVPCHRVVGHARPLLYAGGEQRKQWLLNHEE